MQPSKGFRVRRYVSNSQVLPNMVCYMSERHSKENMKLFGSMWLTEKGLAFRLLFCFLLVSQKSADNLYCRYFKRYGTHGYIIY